MNIMKMIFGLIVTVLFGATFFIPESISSAERLRILNEELAVYSKSAATLPVEPDHPEVRNIIAAADAQRLVSYRKYFNYTALIIAPLLAWIIALFLTSIYIEVSSVFSMLLVFLTYHGATGFLGVIFYLVLFLVVWLIYVRKKALN